MRTKYNKRCPMCKKQFETVDPRAVCCSQSCASTKKNQDRGCSTNKARLCYNCGVVFRPKAAARKSFCSRECAFERQRYDGFNGRLYRGGTNATPRWRKKAKRLVKWMERWRDNRRVCPFCLRRFSARVDRQQCCSRPECRRESNRRSSRNAPESRRCAVCGVMFDVPWLTNRTRCDTCNQKYVSQKRRALAKQPEYRRMHRHQKYLREMRERTTMVEDVSPVQIFKRDGWRCVYCGISTPRSLRGSNESEAPELEHMRPLSRGGAHTRANLACACRRCNMQKHTKTAAEFMGDLWWQDYRHRRSTQRGKVLTT